MFLNSIYQKTLLYSTLFSLMLLLLMNSCAPSALKGLKKSVLSDEISIPSTISFNQRAMAKYRCKIEAFDQKISGVLIFKQQIDTLRVVMITDFGLKVIDLSFYEETNYKINHIMKHLDYEFVRESFALNILMLLPQKQNNVLIDYEDDDQNMIYDSKHSMLYYFKDHQKYRVDRYRSKSKLISMATINQETKECRIEQLNPAIQIILKPLK